MRRNDMKYKYMLLSPLKNVARIGLTLKNISEWTTRIYHIYNINTAKHNETAHLFTLTYVKTRVIYDGIFQWIQVTCIKAIDLIQQIDFSWK